MQRNNEALSEQQVQAYLDTYHQLASRHWRVVLPLFIAGVAQGVLCAPLIEAYVAPGLWAVGLAIAETPWLVCFAATFCRVPPPVSPRTFGRILLFVAYWHAATTVLAVPIVLTGVDPWHVGTPYGIAVVAGCGLLGWLAVPTLVRFSRALEHQHGSP